MNVSSCFTAFGLLGTARCYWPHHNRKRPVRTRRNPWRKRYNQQLSIFDLTSNLCFLYRRCWTSRSAWISRRRVSSAGRFFVILIQFSLLHLSVKGVYLDRLVYQLNFVRYLAHLNLPRASSRLRTTAVLTFLSSILEEPSGNQKIYTSQKTTGYHLVSIIMTTGGFTDLINNGEVHRRLHCREFLLPLKLL